LKQVKLEADHAVQIDCNGTSKTIVIEMDGIQHFEPVEFFGGEPTFKKNQERDARKDAFCCNNKIWLLRIDDTVDCTTYPIQVRRFLDEVATHETPVVCRIGTHYLPSANVPIQTDCVQT